MQTINISDTFGRPYCKARVVAFSIDKALALHQTKTEANTGWTVTHVRTGAALVDGVPFKDAERIMDASELAYGKQLRRIQFAAKPLAKSLRSGIALIIRETMGNRSPRWAMEA